MKRMNIVEWPSKQVKIRFFGGETPMLKLERAKSVWMLTEHVRELLEDFVRSRVYANEVPGHIT